MTTNDIEARLKEAIDYLANLEMDCECDRGGIRDPGTQAIFPCTNCNATGRVPMWPMLRWKCSKTITQWVIADDGLTASSHVVDHDTNCECHGKMWIPIHSDNTMAAVLRRVNELGWDGEYIWATETESGYLYCYNEDGDKMLGFTSETGDPWADLVIALAESCKEILS